MNAPPVMPNLVNRKAPMDYVAALVLLARLGVDLNRIEILAAGEYENYKGEIRSQTPEPGEPIGPDTQVALEVGFPSAVDQMPYQFFYGLEHRADVGREWERRSRELMAPFDAAVIRYEGMVEQQSLRLALSHFDKLQIDRLLKVFGLPPLRIELDERELMLLVSLLPRYNEWAGNAEQLTEVLGTFFGFKCRVIENIPRRYDTPQRLWYRLGDRGAGLGRETLVGSSFTESDSACLLVIYDLEPDRVQQLLPGKPLRGKLDWFLRLSMPGLVLCDVRLRPRETGITLGGKPRPTYLGLASCL
ncbi:hypothetical protein GF377_10255 [candidate division GN15 bacterium]|nr:hypothetical protein [candidate division GN15 bacterium]